MSRRFFVINFDLSVRMEELKNFEKGDIIYCIPTSSVYEVYENEERQKELWYLYGGNLLFRDGSIAISAKDVFEILKRKFQENKIEGEYKEEKAEDFKTSFDKNEKYLHIHVGNFKEVMNSIIKLAEILKK